MKISFLCKSGIHNWRVKERRVCLLLCKTISFRIFVITACLQSSNKIVCQWKKTTKTTVEEWYRARERETVLYVYNTIWYLTLLRLRLSLSLCLFQLYAHITSHRSLKYIQQINIVICLSFNYLIMMMLKHHCSNSTTLLLVHHTSFWSKKIYIIWIICMDVIWK